MPSITYRCIRCREIVTEQVKGPHVCKKGLCKPCTRKIVEEAFDSTGQVEIYQRIVSRLDRRRIKRNGKSSEKQKESSSNFTEAPPEENRTSRNRASTRAA